MGRAVVLAALLAFSPVAFGQEAATDAVPSDKPLLLKIKGGVVHVQGEEGSSRVMDFPAGYCMTNLGYERLDNAVAQMQRVNAALDRENADLKAAATPGSKALTVVVVAVVALGAGFAAGALLKK